MTRDDTLIRMANQIGTFFESMPDRAEALAGIAKHLKNFWDPRMRQALLALLDSADTPAIKAIVREAIQAHRDMLA
ncbi:formate dehydrogenase subunit delta [Rhodoferax sp.]|uniref:formate dehydrogenase subunit delta n=1 Tax=Rhodoferax sp. TaxID=50421 RepID=UPI0026385DF5|nr:formate dehydrogenase subunit delta [Rhodoferax sp.]MDD2925086.1 formate dehydrogenase subunit delta [Rhodoferax sp.]